MTSTIRKAVIPAAGLGTRMLPVSRAFPKELLPIGEFPALHYVLCEAARAGIETVVLVNSGWKRSLEDYLDVDADWLTSLEQQGHGERLAALRELHRRIEVVSVRQRGALGLGHAVAAAMPVIGDDPFAVLLPDEVLLGRPGALNRLVEVAREGNIGAVGVSEVGADEVQRYGIVDCESVPGRIRDLVEKPAPHAAPSRWAILGRYVFPRGFRDALTNLEPGAGGELQLTDAMRRHLDRFPLAAVPVTEARHDTGNPAGYAAAWQAYLANPEPFLESAWPA